MSKNRREFTMRIGIGEASGLEKWRLSKPSLTRITKK
jgi:hypothetical protein